MDSKSKVFSVSPFTVMGKVCVMKISLLNTGIRCCSASLNSPA